ncbi:MAG TPA: G5 domain-containing protein [Candidatus Saccharimonadales bacterium]|nr:G5 domain-containing protein [Candidatus Saccharimonadales bacterium]
MKNVKAWFNGLSNVGKVATVSTAFLLSMGTINAMANQGQSPAPAATPAPVAAPVTTYKEVQETESVVFEKTTQNDAARDVDTSAVTTAGQNGVKTKTYKLTLVDGKETARILLKEEVTTLAVSEVMSIGTKQPYVAPAPRAPSSSCDPNYTGCVPIASDVDCAGGSGNGPAYVSGPVQVIGSDIYGLDRDGNGIGCE